MSIQPLQISFTTKRKTGNPSLHTLFVRISVGNSHSLISLRKDLDPNQWDHKNQRLKSKSTDQVFIANMIHQYRNKATEIYQDALMKGIEPSVDLIRNRLTGKSQLNSAEVHLLELMDRMIKRKLDLQGKNNSPATVQKYRRCKTHLQEMIKVKYKVEDLPFSKINLVFIENLEVHLRQHGCSHNTSMKYVQTFKSVVHHARAHGYMTHDPFLQFKINLRTVDRPYLSEEEIEKLLEFAAPTDKLRKVRDLFVFSCYTGLAYIDLKGLKVKHICHEQGRYWIRTRRQKTDTRTNIPLLEIPMSLIHGSIPELNESDSETQVFKVPSNQKMNKYLKELATQCQISKCLTFHVARHTFATTITLSNGVPIESVSAMLGHKNLTTTQHYAKLIDKKLEEDMNNLAVRLNRQKL
jgi:site-specific recombinase XerD